MIHGVAVHTGFVITVIAIMMWHRHSSRVILAVMARHIKTTAMVPKATVQVNTIFLVVAADIVCSSSSLNFSVELTKMKIGNLLYEGQVLVV